MTSESSTPTTMNQRTIAAATLIGECLDGEVRYPAAEDNPPTWRTMGPWVKTTGNYWMEPWGQDHRSKHAKLHWPPGRVIMASPKEVLLAIWSGHPLYRIPRSFMRLVDPPTFKAQVNYLPWSVQPCWIPFKGYAVEPEDGPMPSVEEFEAMIADVPNYDKILVGHRTPLPKGKKK